MSHSLLPKAKSFPSFQITHRIELPDYWPPLGIRPSPSSSRRLIPQPYVLHEVSDEYFIGTHPLYMGRNRWSQVYRGQLVSVRLRGPLEDTVMKMFFSDKFPGRNADPETMKSDSIAPWSTGSYRCTEELMAWTEAWAYGRLVSLQGNIVPKFIDSVMVRSGNSQAMAVAMTFVKGIPLVLRCQQLGAEEDGNTTWYPLVRDMFHSVFKIHELGVCGLDIRNGNVLVDPSNADSLTVFDFGCSRPTSFSNEMENEIHRVLAARKRDVTDLMHLVGQVCGDCVDGRRQGHATRRWDFVEWFYELDPQEECIPEWVDWLEGWKP